MFTSKTSDVVKLVDFGFAKCFDPSKGLDDMLGTPIYMPPEILKNQVYDSRVDIWSLGVIVIKC